MSDFLKWQNVTLSLAHTLNTLSNLDEQDLHTREKELSSLAQLLLRAHNKTILIKPEPTIEIHPNDCESDWETFELIDLFERRLYGGRQRTVAEKQNVHKHIADFVAEINLGRHKPALICPEIHEI
jgi:hypothetical protein